MMSLLLGNRTNLIDKVQGRTKIGKRKTSNEMVSVRHLPEWNLELEPLQFRTGERRYAATTRYTVLFRKIHRLDPLLQRTQAPRKMTSYLVTFRPLSPDLPTVAGRSNQGISSTVPHISQTKW